MSSFEVLYEDGFAQGWEEGRCIGYDEGWNDARVHYEDRLSHMWAEMQTLNARIDYLHTQLDKAEN